MNKHFTPPSELESVKYCFWKTHTIFLVMEWCQIEQYYVLCPLLKIRADLWPLYDPGKEWLHSHLLLRTEKRVLSWALVIRNQLRGFYLSTFW